ncbi:MAG TPA: double-strand break repair protein AddB [Bauldia sp.]|nr:double-strand break repair protein AddB [Bauldia sp.]
MADTGQPRVFTIPAGAPFLTVLADALLGGALVPLPGGDPLALAGVTVLLPTRRAARAFSDVLAARLAGKTGAAILPVIRPIGDIDEDEALLDPEVVSGEEGLVLPPAITPLSRRLALTRLTLAWAKGLRHRPLGMDVDEPFRVPASAGDATRLAADLAGLFDDMATAEVGWVRIAKLVPDDHADYFRLTLEFLAIVSERWPEYLRDTNRADPGQRRDALIRRAAAHLARNGSPGPIVTAGSTGSIPATAALLRAVARLPNGAVVLPGLDQHLDDAGWNAVGAGEDAPAATYGHPQFGLKQLLTAIGIERDAVAPLGAPVPAAQARAVLLSEVMRPAATLEKWAHGASTAPGSLDGLDLIVARTEQEEATAIALAMREAVETPGRTAALVTPDRTLARRVAAELARWNLVVDDSAGTRLDREPHGVFARLLLDAAASEADPVKLLALAKHPFAAFGMARAECREAARALELALFRGHRIAGGIGGLATALSAAYAARSDRHAAAARRRLKQWHWDRAMHLAARLASCLAPLEEASTKGASAAEIARLLAAALVLAATDHKGADDLLWQGQGGAALAELLEGVADDPEAAALMLGPADAPFFFGALLADIAVSRPTAVDPRLHIWGTLEARLQSVDVLVLGGLDEGIWPATTRTDPWLSRAMRAEIGLPPPERRLGLAAHDFMQGVAAPQVIVTRAEKRGGAPTVESRWLQRLRALAGKAAVDTIASRGRRYLDWARSLDVADKPPTLTPRPEPKPPLAARPASLSITEIETLIRDPYAIYARRILNLEPLEPLGRAPDGGLRGNIVHEALGNFTAEWRGPYDAAAEARLRAIAGEALKAVADFPDVHAVWALRLGAIARWLIAFEAARDVNVAARHAEIDGTMPVIPGFTLRGRADRVDLMRDGSVAIYDYKTSTPQTERTVFAGLTPQMSLEAAMAKAGGFPGIPAGAGISELAWLKVGRIGLDEPYESAASKQKKQTPDLLAESATRLLRDLMAKYADPGTGYLSRARPMMEKARYIGDYDHLARVREWALIESLEDVAAMGAQAP